MNSLSILMALVLLGNFGCLLTWGAEPLPANIQGLVDSLGSEDNRAYAAKGRLVALGKSAVRGLTEVFVSTTPNESSRWMAATALGEIGPEALDAIPVLVDALRGNGYWVGAVQEALPKIGGNSAEALCDEMRRVKGISSSFRIQLIEALGKFGRKADGCFDELYVIAMADEFSPKSEPVNYHDNLYATMALTEIAPERSVDCAAQSLLRSSSSITERTTASGFLARFGPIALPSLIKGLGDPNEITRVAAASGVKFMAVLIGNTPNSHRGLWISALEATAPQLEVAERDSMPRVRELVIEAFRETRRQKEAFEAWNRRQELRRRSSSAGRKIGP